MMHVYYEKYDVVLHRENATGCFYNRVIRFANLKENKRQITNNEISISEKKRAGILKIKFCQGTGNLS